MTVPFEAPPPRPYVYSIPSESGRRAEYSRAQGMAVVRLSGEGGSFTIECCPLSVTESGPAPGSLELLAAADQAARFFTVVPDAPGDPNDPDDYGF